MKLYYRRSTYQDLYEFYHECNKMLYSVYYKENTRHPNKCPQCFFQIPSIYLMGGNNYEEPIYASKIFKGISARCPHIIIS